MRIIFAGGGTAGHVNPAIAAADYIKSRENCEIYFSGSKGHIEEKLVPRSGYEIFLFPLRGLSRALSPKGLRQNAAAVQNALAAVRECKRIIRRLQPDIVVGTGGYASFPMVYAAQKCGVRTALLEVNATPGMATRRLVKGADCVMISHAETEKLLGAAKRVVLTGSPVRREIAEIAGKKASSPFGGELPVVLSFWGSGGAQYMNEKMVDFICLAAEKRELANIHASGSRDYEKMKEALAARGCDPEHAENILLCDYIYDMDKKLAQADLVICRAGGTLAELCAAGKPAIVVPSPHVTDNHQEKNARILERAGAVKVALENEISGAELYDMAARLLKDREEMARMSACALKRAQPDALENIYNAIRDTVMH
ncbi:MAG: UDP-N-acetylglucosamine--N-acetylmuramyl-(pentapeptide) pyrophosphoryl-undecaprenol N-acetylglucosamine transferase [Clostridia bacterium]|nr:UDP-N-acetylglucosamine--N-acetylmuramyl-(pentapeptide) pyrophosphoryl-undecaprenol N-acetylglucosamine transferase [Clostridia bacterium]